MLYNILNKILKSFAILKHIITKFAFLDEPVQQWEFIIDVQDGKNAIQKFYENNEKYAFHFK